MNPEPTTPPRTLTPRQPNAGDDEQLAAQCRAFQRLRALEDALGIDD